MERKKGVVEICYQVVLIIYKKMHLWKIPVPGRDRVKTDGENDFEVVSLTKNILTINRDKMGESVTYVCLLYTSPSPRD